MEDRETYYQTLEIASINEDFQPITQFITDNVQQSIERNLKMLDREWETRFLEWKSKR